MNTTSWTELEVMVEVGGHGVTGSRGHEVQRVKVSLEKRECP